MRRLLRTLLLLAVALVFGAIIFGIKLLSDAGQFATLAPASDLLCEPRSGIAGAEDAVADRANNLVYLSAFDRRAALEGRGTRGHIFVLDLNDPTTPLRDITPDEPRDFSPHGIGLYKAPTGETSLFVVNHPGGTGQLVEIFDLTSPTTLVHRTTISDTGFVSLNDVAPVGPRQFYVTNDHAHVGGFRQAVEDYLRTNETNALYFDGTTAEPAALGLTLANGMAVSADGTRVYIAETTDKQLRTYARDPETGVLAELGRIELASGPDNIDVDSDGSLWVAAHPKLFDLIAHLRNPSHRSPSQVLRIVPGSDGGGAVRQVYLNMGDEISGASVAVPVGERVVIGSIFEPKILVCRMKLAP